MELYSDGILLGKGPFRAIQNCSLFLQDLQDGFFPAELQSKYPEGVIFDLHDLHTKVYLINKLQLVIVLNYDFRIMLDYSLELENR